MGGRADRFTVHRASSWPLFFGVLMVLTAIETPLVHWAVAASGHAIAAWVLTVMSIDTAVWLALDLRALARGGVSFGADALELRIGSRWRGTIPYAAITGATRGAAPDKAVDFSILGADVVLELNEPCTMRGLLGRRRKVTRVGLSIDDLEPFLARLARVSSART
jgi:hypothetical protein